MRLSMVLQAARLYHWGMHTHWRISRAVMIDDSAVRILLDFGMVLVPRTRTLYVSYI